MQAHDGSDATQFHDEAEATQAYDGVDATQVVDRNDGALIRLLASREPVDLHLVETTLADDYAFPMFARNRLLGVLVCREKTDGVTAYAPDEIEAIGSVAHAAGLALDLLRIGALERELAGLRDGRLRARYGAGA